MSLCERVKKIRETLGKTQKEIAGLVDVGLRTWQQYEEGVHDPSWKVISNLSELGFNVDWLATGEGRMWREGFGPALAAAVAASHDMITGDEQHRGAGSVSEGFVQIPLYDVRAAAGGGAVVEYEEVIDFLYFKTEWVRVSLNASPKDLYLIHVEGESMEPTLRPGDVILVDHRAANTLPRDGIYVLRMDDTLLVKRLQRLPGNVIKVTSDNPAYDPFTISLGDAASEVAIIGRVVW